MTYCLLIGPLLYPRCLGIVFVLLGQLAQCLHFALHCPSSWMLSGFLIRFHFGGVEEQVDFSLLDFHLSLCYTEMSVLCYESCQCIWKLWILECLTHCWFKHFLLTILVQRTFCAECRCYCWGVFHSVSGFNEDILLDKFECVNG